LRTFKRSNDPKFAEKVEDVVGLYMDPPAHAVVISIDEKSQIQALDRTQPGLPLKPGKSGTMTHDYKRDGTTTLFAALNILDGTVVGHCMPKHTHKEFIKFLNAVERAVPTGIGIGPDERRRVLGVSVALPEAEVHWRAFLESPHQRGLRGVEFIASERPRRTACRPPRRVRRRPMATLPVPLRPERHPPCP
jgi:hypothetical protein